MVYPLRLPARTSAATTSPCFPISGSSQHRPKHRVSLKVTLQPNESLTAVGILSRVFVGEDPRKSEVIQKGVDLCSANLPVWNEEDGSIDMYYWYYGTLALFQVGHEPWKRWSDAIKDAIVDHQRKDGDEKGSWDPIGAWGRDGGRVYSTAVCVMCMEVWYRYPQIFTGR